MQNVNTALSRYVNDDVERQWTSHKPDGKDTISWEEYRFNSVLATSDFDLAIK